MKPIKGFYMKQGGNNYRESAIYRLACVYLCIEKKISDYLRPFKLSPAKFNALMVIKHKGMDKGLSQIEIGKSLIVSPSNITRLLDKLDKDGFIERLSQAGDRRVKLIKISRKGSDILDNVWPGYCKEVTKISNLLTNDELMQISNLFLKWWSKLKG